MNGTRPPSGESESCIVLTAPHDASVVTVAKRAELNCPKRTSLPSTDGLVKPRAGFGCNSAHQRVTNPARNRTNIADQIDHPWRRTPAINPNIQTSAEPNQKMTKTSVKFVSGVGFSNGCALF